jgi:hypothetical protein
VPNPADEIEAVAGRLLESSPLTALVQDRAYPNAPARNAAKPYLVFFTTGGGDGNRLSRDRGLKQSEVRIEAHGRSEEESRQVLRAARGQLHCWRDRGQGVQGCFARGDADEVLTETEEHVASQTFGLSFAPQA